MTKRIKKQKKFLVLARAIFLFFAVALVAVVVALAQIDINGLRKSLLGVLRSSTGLPIEINGEVSWKLSLRPIVTMKQVTVGEQGQDKNAFRADTVEVTLNLMSLFLNRPTIQRVSIKNAQLDISKNEQGKYFFQDSPNKEEPDNKDRPDYPFTEPGLGRLTITDLVVNVDKEKYILPRMDISYVGTSKKREYRGWFKSDAEVVPFIVSFEKYNAERKVYPMKIALSSDGDALIASIALEGTSKIPIDFIIKGDIPDVRPIGKLFNMELMKMPKMKVNIAGGMGHDSLTLHKSSVAIRGSNLDISGAIDWAKSKTKITAKISSKKINLKEVFPELYSGQPFPKGYKPNVFHNMPLFGSFLYDKQIDAQVNLGSFVVYRNLSLDNFKVDFKVQDANVRLDTTTGFADGNIVAAISGNIEENGKMNLEMGGIGESITMGKLMSQINEDNFISELPLDFQIYTKASGANMSEIMQTITGPVRVYSVGKGYAHSDLVAYMYGEDFLTNLRHNIQDMFRSKKKYDQMTINAVVVNLNLRNGVAETRNGAAIETNAINIMLHGDIDLGREKINLALTTIPVRGLKLSLSGQIVNTITISGNLAEPDISISGAAIAGKALSATGLGLMLAPFTGGLGLVAGAGVGLLAGDLLENWLADDHPCKTAMKRGAPLQSGDPDWFKIPAQDLANVVINSHPDDNFKK